jgi:hypothetical protein
MSLMRLRHEHSSMLSFDMFNRYCMAFLEPWLPILHMQETCQIHMLQRPTVK